MAKKKKGKRILIGLKCTECNRVNYITSKSKINTPDKVEFMKYCAVEHKKTLHKETTKLD